MRYDTTELMLRNQRIIMSALSELLFTVRGAQASVANKSISTDLTTQISATLGNLSEREANRQRGNNE